MKLGVYAVERSRAGLSLLELLIVLFVMSVATGMFATTVYSTAGQRIVNRESAIAAEAAREMIERMREERFEDLFVLYNEYPLDDPGGPDTAPANRFFVEGLDPVPGSSALIGEIVFPTLLEGEDQGDREIELAKERKKEAKRLEKEAKDRAKGKEPKPLKPKDIEKREAKEKEEELERQEETQVREDYVDERMGMPRDLNGDGLTDDEDHAEDYMILPVQVRIEWQGRLGPRELTFYTMMTLMDS